MERNGSCKNFANASNFATKNWGKAESRQWSSWQRWKEQRVPGRGSHMQLPHGCKIYENWFSLKRAKPKPKPDNLMPAWEKLWKLHLMTFWLETCQTILIEASGLIPFVFSCSLFIFFALLIAYVSVTHACCKRLMAGEGLAGFFHGENDIGSRSSF